MSRAPTEFPRHRLVQIVAHQMERRLGFAVRLPELYDLGLPGLATARAEWDGRGNFDAFAIQRIRWAMIDELRKRRRNPQSMALAAAELAAHQHGRTREDVYATSTNPRAAAEENIEEVVDSGAGSYAVDIDAAEAVETDSERMRLRRAVTDLPPPQDQVIHRHSYLGESFQEVSEALGIPRATVFDLYSKAVTALRRSFATSHEAPDQPSPP